MFYGITIPLTKDGNGPASEEDTANFSYEVWDQTYLTVIDGFSSLGEAQRVAQQLNEYWSKINGP